MAQPPTAGSPGGPRSPTSPALPGRGTHHDTARISLGTPSGSGGLPGWFWGALGCFSVLVVGLSLMFFVFRPDGTPPAATAGAAPGGSVATTASGSRGGAIQVEPIASPPSPALKPLAPKPRATPRPVKLARSPSGGARPKAESGASTDEDKGGEPAPDEAAAEEEVLRPRKPTAAATRERQAPPADDSDNANENQN